MRQKLIHGSKEKIFFSVLGNLNTHIFFSRNFSVALFIITFIKRLNHFLYKEKYSKSVS